MFDLSTQSWIIIGIVIILIYYFLIYKKSDEGFDSSNLENWQSILTNLFLNRLIYTRLALLAMFKNSPELKQLDFELVHNQKEITKLVKTVYNCKISEKLSVLLTRHMILVSVIMNAIKHNKPVGRDAEINQFYDTSQEIYQLLYQFVSGRKDITSMLKMHIDTFVKDIVILSEQYWWTDTKGLEEYLINGAKISLKYGEDNPQFAKFAKLL